MMKKNKMKLKINIDCGKDIMNYDNIIIIITSQLKMD